MEALYYETLPSPVGKILIAVSERGLFALDYPLKETPEKALSALTRRFPFQVSRSAKKTAEAKKQLKRYFAGKLKNFTLPLDMRGTPFQAKVWRELQRIPLGRTASYGDIAKRIGKPGAARAVGMANNRNKIGIVIPCHRVIGANGAMVGYAGGLKIKDWLLKHEQKLKYNP